MNNLLSKRFVELEQQINDVMSTRNTYNSGVSSYDNVDNDTLLQWKVKVKNLIVKVCGEDSQHFKAFEKADDKTSWGGSFSTFKSLKAVFLATKEDYEGGYLSSYKSIVQAEVFENELEQASELLNNGYYIAAAIISGVVLETTLRELCDREKIQQGSLNKMNQDLAKAGVYNKIVQKQITAHAGIRNSAAHGKQSEFNKTDVEQMIPSIEQFLVKHLDG